MPSSDDPQQCIAQARNALQLAQQQCAAYGLDLANARAELERHMLPEDIAQVDAEIEEQRQALQHLAAPRNSGSKATPLRRHRSII